MIIPWSTVKTVNQQVGLGVFATRPIPRGTITYAQDPLDLVIHADDPRRQAANLSSHIEKYSYTDRNGDSILSWDNAKFMNHSCDANSLTTGFGFEIAVRDIAQDEQITDDYGLLNITRAMVPCRCQAETCRQAIVPRAMPQLVRDWNTKVARALREALIVDQPLWPYLSPSDRDDIADIVYGQTTAPGVESMLRDYPGHHAPQSPFESQRPPGHLSVKRVP